jgi:hypothetical protein
LCNKIYVDNLVSSSGGGSGGSVEISPELLTDVATLKTDKAKNKTDIGNSKTDNDTNKIDISSLKSDNTTNKTDISNLKTDNDTNKDNISQLLTDVGSIFDSMSQQESLTQISLDIKALQTDVSGNIQSIIVRLCPVHVGVWFLTIVGSDSMYELSCKIVKSFPCACVHVR